MLLKQEQVKDPVKLANAIHVTKDEAKQVVFKMETAQPVTTYYVQAPTVEQAAKQTQQDIKREGRHYLKQQQKSQIGLLLLLTPMNKRWMSTKLI